MPVINSGERDGGLGVFKGFFSPVRFLVFLRHLKPTISVKKA